MILQPQCVNLSIASPTEIERTARQLMAIREDFLSTGSLALWTPRPMILDSWLRCRTLQVNPSRRCAPLAVARETQLEQLRRENALLIEAARPVINQLFNLLAASGYVIVLSDKRGYLLDVAGDIAIRRRLERIDFIPGGNWSEAAAGTNAIGTALADGHSVQLMAAEHYCDGWQDLTCTATPIHHPLTREVIGILDVTGDYHLIRSFLKSTLAQAALDIQHYLLALLPLYQHAEEQHSIWRAPLWQLHTVQIEAWTMDNTYLPQPPSNTDAAHTSPVVDMQWQLNMQERRAYEAERLVAATGLISASLDLEITIEQVIEQSVHLLHVEKAAVLLFHDDGKIASIRMRAEPQSSPSRHESLKTQLKNSSAITLVRERGEPVVINDASNTSLVPASFMIQTGMRAAMFLPLMTPRGVRGCIIVARSIPYAWTLAEIHLGLAIATQSATSIENARLFEDLQQHNRHIETLNAISQILNTFPDPGHHIDLALQRIAETLNVDAGIIMLFDQASKELILTAQCNIPEHLPFAIEEWSWRAIRMLARRVVTQHEPVMIHLDDSEESAMHKTLRLLGFSKVIAVPIATSDATLGVLLVASNSLEGFMQEDLKFFSTIGQQLGLALRNAQLRRSASEMEALREADRLKSSFLAAVSHDLCSPLTAIRASVESLLDADGIQSEMGQEHLLLNIAGQAHRLGFLVDQLLDLSRIEAGTLPLDCDWVELSALISDAIDEFAHLHKGCRVERVLAPNLPLHYIDPDRFEQVLWNLLENAYKYSPPGSPVRVEADTREQEVVISVADSGPGIPAGEREKVFQCFYRLERDQRMHSKGSGLGLTICKGIVEAHGGRIWIEEREGGGSIFRIALRLPEPQQAGFASTETQTLVL